MGTTTYRKKLLTFPAFRICEHAKFTTIIHAAAKQAIFFLSLLIFSLSGQANMPDRLFTCTADAGTMSPDCANGEFCMSMGMVTISASPDGNSIIPSGYRSLYVLTRGTGLAYVDSSSSPSFNLNQAASYRIHHLVYDANPASPDFLDLTSFVPGQSNLSDLINLINSSGVCADLDQQGVYLRARKCFIFFHIQARDDFLNTLTNKPVSGNILNNDMLQAGQNYDLNVLGGPFYGSLALNSDGSMVYVPDAGYSGKDEFTYQICDQSSCPARCVQATVYIEVIDTQAFNNPPVANLDAVCVPAGNSIEVDVRFNDIDQDGDALQAPTPHTAPSYGSLIYEANGNITYTPNMGFTGYDLFTYQVCDAGNPSICDVGLVTIRVKSSSFSGNPPIPMDDAITMPRNTGRFGQTVIDNDFEPDGDAITYSLDTPPLHGNLVFYPNGDYDYIPNTDYIGPDFFVYNMSDVDGSAKASVIITVHGNGTSFPVEWLDFTASQDKADVHLEWATASELNNSHFEVERSVDRGERFFSIGEVRGAGSSDEPQFYTFVDPSVYDFGGERLIYRLKQVDLNGSFEYSKSLELEIEPGTDFQLDLYPNPAQKELNISWSGNMRLSSITLYDLLGEIHLQKKWEQAEKRGLEKIDLTDLSPGLYLLKYEGDRESAFRKIRIH